MRAAIICGGDIGNIECARKLIRDNDMIICADSGYKYISELCVRPDIVLGDFDSYDEKKVIAKKITYPVHKDFTDSEIALDYAIEHGAGEVLFLAATGGRIDHTLANIYLLKAAFNKGIKAYMYDGKSMIYYTEDEIELFGQKGDILSLIPFDNAKGITTFGLEYSLSRQDLAGVSTGVSNVFLVKKVGIKIESGSVLVIHTPREYE